MCKTEGRPVPDHLNTSTISDRMLVQLVHKIVYCPVEKVASTFWKRTLYALMSSGETQSPFMVKIPGRKTLILYQTFRQKFDKSDLDIFRSMAESLLVVRNPYDKLFSAYMDKLFHPNFMFWKAYGERIKQVIRKYKNPNSDLICGNDVTFSEYVKYILYAHKENIDLNPHFTSISKHCDPCLTKYTYISKMETLKSDFEYIVGHWNRNFKLNMSDDVWEKQNAMLIAKTHVKISFKTFDKFGKICNLRKFLFLQRTWRFLQASGIISKQYSCPFPDDALTSAVTEKDLLRAVENVLDTQPSWEIVKQQRKEALIEAYRTIDKEDMAAVRELVIQDAQYFDYNDRPKELFGHFGKNGLENDSFKYFDIV